MINPVFLYPAGKSKEVNSSFAFGAKVFVKKGAKVTFSVCAKNLYNVYADGKFLGCGPSHAADGISEVDVFDLSPFAGREIPLSVEVLSYNVPLFEAADDRPFFCAEVGEDGRVLASSGDFSAHVCTDKPRKVARYSYQRAFTEYDVLACDVRNKFRNGDFSVFPTCETEPADPGLVRERGVPYPRYENAPGALIEEGGVEFDENAERRTDRFISDVSEEKGSGFAEKSFERDAVDVVSKIRLRKDSPSADRYKLYDFGKEYSGFTRLSLDAAEDLTVYILFDEILMDRGEESETGKALGDRYLDPFRMRTLNILSYELKKGHYELQSREPYSMRYAAVAVCGGRAENLSLSLLRFENAEAQRLRFSCADPDLVKIVEAARNTFAQNAVDNFTDCPSRERGGWLCDAYFTSMAEKLFTGDNAVERHFLGNFADCPEFSYLPKGMIPMVYPSSTVSDRFIPNWAMWYVEEIADSVKRSGNAVLNEATKKKMEGLLDYFARFENEDGLLESLESWVFVEWSKANDYVQDVNYPSNMLYSHMLRCCAELLGRPGLIAKADRIKAYIRKNAKKGIFYVDNSVRNADGRLVLTDHTTETCQYYALYFGVATIEEDAELFSLLLEKFGANRDEKTEFPDVPKSNSIVGNYLRLDFLARNGFGERIAGECREYFLYMAERTGTLWEHDNIRASCNHGFASYAANILIMGLCGVRLVQSREKVIYTVPSRFDTDCEISFPCHDGGYVNVRVRNGVRTIDCPKDWEIRE